MDLVAACPPVFRDAIVFYSAEDKILGILQVCLECSKIKDEAEETQGADYRTYKNLANLLKEVGHEIE